MLNRLPQLPPDESRGNHGMSARSTLLRLIAGLCLLILTACSPISEATNTDGQSSESDKVSVTIDGQTFFAGIGDVIGEGEKMANGLCDVPPHTVSAGRTGPGRVSVSVGTDAECRLIVRSIEYADSPVQPPDIEGGESRAAEPADDN